MRKRDETLSGTTNRTKEGAPEEIGEQLFPWERVNGYKQNFFSWDPRVCIISQSSRKIKS
jgi:hypothetical protein